MPRGAILRRLPRRSPPLLVEHLAFMQRSGPSVMPTASLGDALGLNRRSHPTRELLFGEAQIILWEEPSFGDALGLPSAIRIRALGLPLEEPSFGYALHLPRQSTLLPQSFVRYRGGFPSSGGR